MQILDRLDLVVRIGKMKIRKSKKFPYIPQSEYDVNVVQQLLD